MKYTPQTKWIGKPPATFKAPKSLVQSRLLAREAYAQRTAKNKQIK